MQLTFLSSTLRFRPENVYQKQDYRAYLALNHEEFTIRLAVIVKLTFYKCAMEWHVCC